MRFPLLLLAVLLAPYVRAQTPDFSFLNVEENAFVRSEVARLSLEQKAGQMTQLAADMFFDGPLYYLTKPYTFNEGKLDTIMEGLAVGSVLNYPSRTYPDLEQWREIHRKLQARALAASGIPMIYGIDAIHGPNYVAGATLYAQPLGMAATFNTELAKELAAITAYELRAAGIPWNFSPAMDVGRNPVWPRNWESFGEDTYVNTQMGLAMVTGYQGDDLSDKTSVAACLKHFTGYGSPRSGRDRTPSYLPERQLREHYFPQFQATIDAGALTIMINSGELNGIPVHVHKELLTDVLRDEMGFEGLLVSDWEDVHYLFNRHKVAADLKEAVRMSIEAGMDMSMTPVSTDFPKLVVELVKEGSLTEARIDLSVARILAVKVALGLYEQPLSDPADYPDFGGEKFAAKARQSAEEAVVLLKNDGLMLPLDDENRILVTGPTADNQRSLNGGWTYSWQGEESDAYLGDYHTIVEGIRAEFSNVSYVPGVALDSVIDVRAAVDAAADVDVIVACVGELSYTEYRGNIDDLTLPAAQVELLEALRATGKPIVLVMASGRPRIMTEFAETESAILYSPYPGPHGGDAIARILSGKVNPSGRLPLTYPRSANALLTYDHKHTEALENNFNPLFQFGHGLGYTTFEYTDLSLSGPSLGPDDDLTVSVTVKNTGNRAGKHSVLLFSSDKVASITPSVRRLRKFTKIELAAGASQTVTFTLTADDLSFVGIDHERVTEEGGFLLMVGDARAEVAFVR